MCLAIPSRILSLHENGETAQIETLGVRQEVVISLLDESPQEGDYILVHAGFAIRKIDLKEALKTIRLHEELARYEATGETAKTER